MKTRLTEDDIKKRIKPFPDKIVYIRPPWQPKSIVEDIYLANKSKNWEWTTYDEINGRR